jgi:hypothetical protein
MDFLDYLALAAVEVDHHFQLLLCGLQQRVQVVLEL